MRLFLDMDGVLADFDLGHELAFGHRPDKRKDDVDWGAIRRFGNFYRTLPPMRDLPELWAGVRDLSPTVLTGVPSSIHEAVDEKRAWAAHHLGPDVPVVCCRSEDKALHGRPGDVLIDDWPKYRGRWLDMGGTWITHTSARQSLAELRDLMAERDARDCGLSP